MGAAAKEPRDGTGTRTLRWLFFATLALLACAFLWVVTRASRPPDRVAWLWTESDLPVAPRPEDNGFASLIAQETRLGKLDIPASLSGFNSPMTGGSEASKWYGLEQIRNQANDYLGAKKTLVWLPGFEESLEFPRFADGCGLRVEDTCPVYLVVRMHRTIELRAAMLGLAGDWGGALEWNRKLVRADVDFVSTARMLAAHMVGMITSRRAVELAALLVDRLKAEGQCPSSHESLSALQTSLSGWKRQDLHMQRAVRAEYISEHALLETAESGPAAGWRGKLFYDRADTLRRFNELFKGWDAFAASPATASPPPAPKMAKWTDFLSNAVGKNVLEMLAIDLENGIRKFDKDRESLLLRRDEVIEAIRVCLAK